MMRGFARALVGAVALTLSLAACTSTSPPPDYAAIINAPDRTAADKKNDERREPVKLLAFTGVRSGWKVLDMAAGAGYSTEIMARAAAPGAVYAQNPAGLPANAKDAYAALGSKLGRKPGTTEVTDLFLIGAAALLVLAGALSALWSPRLP